MNLTEIAAQIHADNVAKGFWDEPRTTTRSLLLILGELSEPLQALRRGRGRADLAAYEEAMKLKLTQQEAFTQHIKDTFEDELADVAIYTLDYLGSLKENFEIPIVGVPEGIDKALLFTYRTYCGHDCQYGLACLISFCADMGIDIFKFIELKLAYNRTRPFKHGKKF